MKNTFRNSIAENVFRHKYAISPSETWQNLAERVVEDVVGTRWGETHRLIDTDGYKRLVKYIAEFKFIPGGRYLYYAGRPLKAYNNCFTLKAKEDTREEWARLAQKAMLFLTYGGGIGIDYSIIRPAGKILKRTGGLSSGAIPLMNTINEIGRNVMQGGSRRSAIYASLDATHEDINEFLHCKDWNKEVVNGITYKDIKKVNFDFPAPLDMTNISINYNYPEWLDTDVFKQNVLQAMKTGEPGFSFNLKNPKETCRNACAEITSEDDSDVCNLGSVNIGIIDSLEELADVCYLGSWFLAAGTIRGVVPDKDVEEVRKKNRRLGLGLMGVHEFLLKRQLPYAMNDTLKSCLEVYKTFSEKGANDFCDRFFLNRPAAYRAIAPTGTIGLIAGTTTGIEPLYAVAYKRRYLQGNTWKHEYVIDATAKYLIEKYSINPENIETALTLSNDIESRIAFQAAIQEYVDMGISSTINLPTWGTENNNEDKVDKVADIIKKYAHILRGLTFYPDGSRGGQPLEAVPYEEAISKQNLIFEEHDSCKGGVCGL